MQFENHELNMNQTIDPNRAILIQHCKSLFCTLFYGKQRNTWTWAFPVLNARMVAQSVHEKKVFNFQQTKTSPIQIWLTAIHPIGLWLPHLFFFGVISFQKKQWIRLRSINQSLHNWQLAYHQTRNIPLSKMRHSLPIEFAIFSTGNSAL